MDTTTATTTTTDPAGSTTSNRATRRPRHVAAALLAATLAATLAAGTFLAPSAAADEHESPEVPEEVAPAGAPAEAADEPSPSGVSLRPNRVPRGGTVTVTGAGFAAGEPVTVTLAGKVVATTFTDDDGFFQTTFAADEPPGTYVVTVKVGDLTYELDLEITGAGGRFADDDGQVHEAAIERLAAAGATSGCAPQRFCPETSLPRAQMATFLDRLLRLPAAEGDTFVDDDGSAHEGAIERLAAAGVTSGCAPERFCPDGTLTRGQVASLLDRVLQLPATDADRFADDDGSVHEGAIERLAAAGITSGCAPERFCPDLPLTRGQMATLLDRSFSLPPITTLASVSTDLDGGGTGDGEAGTPDPGLPPGQVIEHVSSGQIDGVDVGTQGGGRIVGVCDVDGDGEGEIVAEDPVLAPGQVITKDLANDADVDVDVVWVGTRGGASVVAMTDLDGDGDCDIVVLDPGMAAGQKVFAKADGDADADVLWVGAAGGVTFVAVADLDADGEADVQLRLPGLQEGQAIDVQFDPPQADGSGDADVDVRYSP